MEFSSSKNRVERWRAKQMEAQFCMVCLNTSEDCKLYAANMYYLDMEYEYLTKISLQGNLPFKPQFCTECTQRLGNCIKFRNKSLRAYHLLLGLVELDKPLTIENIKILSKSNNLTSSLAKKSFQPDYCDLSLNHEELQEQAKLQQELATIEPIKVEPDLPNNKPIETQKDLSNNEAIKIEVKLFNGKLMLNPIPELENKVGLKSFDDSHSDVDIHVDYIDDDNYFDIDTYCDKRLKDKVDKFVNDVMNDADNDWDILRESDSDNDLVSGTKTEIKINVEKERVREPRRTILKGEKKKTQQTIDEMMLLNGENIETQQTIDEMEYLKYFSLTELTREEQLEDIQKRKQTANYIKGIFKCDICFKGFVNSDPYKTHMDRHTDKYGKSVCPICALHFSSDYLMRHHVNRSHSTRYSCLHCPLVTNYDGAAINHANMHRGVTYTCPRCFEVHRSKSGYLSHLRIMHPTDSVCTQCGFSFVNERGLRSHINLKHHNEDLRDPTGPLCEECDIRFASAEAYYQHVEVSHHTAGRQRRRTTPKTNIGRVSRRRSNTPVSVTCEQCGEEFKGFAKYYHHFRQAHPTKTRTQYPHHRSKILCEQCGKSFNCVAMLRDHKLTHTGKRPFQCDVCKKWFYLKATLATHLATHSATRPLHACAVCGKKFVTKGNRDKHLWTHKEQKPHPCRACDKSFANPSTLRTHVAHAHQKKPYPKKSRGPRQRASRARHAKEPVCGTIIWPQVKTQSPWCQD